MTNNFIRKISVVFCGVLLLSFSSCRQPVILVPGDEDLVLLNGCVVSACNYLAVVKAQHSLDQNFWAKILLVRFENHPAGHAYCVWETEGNIYGYDRNSGAFPIPIHTRDPRTIAIILAQELAKYLHEPLAVSHAEFINSSEVELYSFGSLELKEDPSPTVLFGHAIPLTSP